jgi:hypothetical protein
LVDWLVGRSVVGWFGQLFGRLVGHLVGLFACLLCHFYTDAATIARKGGSCNICAMNEDSCTLKIIFKMSRMPTDLE